jgi:hypothetical protein
MSRIDAVYTPDWLADELVGELPADLCGAVVDPCVGEGALLAAIQRRFGDALSLNGIDIHAPTVNLLRRAQPNWSISIGDSLNERSIRSTRIMRGAHDGIAAVVLNPPFSFRGWGGVYVRFEDSMQKVTPSVGFVHTALTVFRPSAGLYAIMPEGAMFGQRSGRVWTSLESAYDVAVTRSVSNSAFGAIRAHTVLVRFTPRPDREAAPATERRVRSTRNIGNCRCVEIVRGRVPRYVSARAATARDAAPYVHTTDMRALRDGTWDTASAPGHAADKATRGPFVLLNRVGAFQDPTEYPFDAAVLSDCLYALRTTNPTLLQDLTAKLRRHSRDLASSYRGTGAPYLTVERLTGFLATIGWKPIFVRASDSPGGCRCRSTTARRARAERLASIA